MKADAADQSQAADQIVHPVQAPEHGALPVPGRAKEAGDLSPLDLYLVIAHGEKTVANTAASAGNQ